MFTSVFTISNSPPNEYIHHSCPVQAKSLPVERLTVSSPFLFCALSYLQSAGASIVSDPSGMGMGERRRKVMAQRSAGGAAVNLLLWSSCFGTCFSWLSCGLLLGGAAEKASVSPSQINL